MNLRASIFKSQKFWMAEIPLIDLITQGKTKEDAVIMVKDALQELLCTEFNDKIQVEIMSNVCEKIGYKTKTVMHNMREVAEPQALSNYQSFYQFLKPD